MTSCKRKTARAKWLDNRVSPSTHTHSNPHSIIGCEESSTLALSFVEIRYYVAKLTYRTFSAHSKNKSLSFLSQRFFITSTFELEVCGVLSRKFVSNEMAIIIAYVSSCCCVCSVIYSRPKGKHSLSLVYMRNRKKNY